MKSIFILSILPTLSILCSPSTAQAKLGETRAQIQVRYGPGTPAGDFAGHPASGYQFKDFKVVVVFDDDGKSIAETLRPIDDARHIDDEEFLSLASAITGGNPWKKQSLAQKLAGQWVQEGDAVFATRTRRLFGADDLTVARMDLLDKVTREDAEAKKQTAAAFAAPIPTNPPASDPAAIDRLAAQILAEQRAAAAARRQAALDAATLNFHLERATNGDVSSQRRLAELYRQRGDTNAAAAWLRAAATNSPAK